MHPLKQKVVCGDKKGFPTQRNANRQLFKYHYDDINMRVYECPLCFMWHLGHKNGRKPPIMEE